jgi:hypothetical protein
MIKAMRIGSTLVCTIDGKMYKKTCETNEEILAIYEQALNTNEYDKQELDDLISIFTPKKTREEQQLEIEFKNTEAEIESQKSLVDWMKELENIEDEYFEVIGLRLYMKGINISIPEFLAKEFVKRKENKEDLNSLMNFWRLCALNPDPRCREDLYGFLIKNDLSVTPSGYFVTYRNVNIMNEGNKEFNDFITNSWFKVKKQKKSPKNYTVFTQDGEYKYEVCSLRSDFIGNLQELYENISNETEDTTIYTDAHTGTFKIKIGQLVSIDRKQCDADPERTCSKGLHSGNLSFMNSQGSSFGSVGIICLINPRDVVAVPTSYDGKMRSSAYLPIALTQYDEEGLIIPVDTATFEYEYATHTQQELEELIKNANLEEYKAHDIIPKEISLIALKNAIAGLRENLDEQTRIINNRLYKV